MFCSRASIPYLDQLSGLAAAVSPFFGRLAVHCVRVTVEPFRANCQSCCCLWNPEHFLVLLMGATRLTLTSKPAERPLLISFVYFSFACWRFTSQVVTALNLISPVFYIIEIPGEFLIYGWPSCLLFKVDPEFFLILYCWSFLPRSGGEWFIPCQGVDLFSLMNASLRMFWSQEGGNSLGKWKLDNNLKYPARMFLIWLPLMIKITE